MLDVFNEFIQLLWMAKETLFKTIRNAMLNAYILK